MAEAFGLDRKINNYKGSHPITLYRRDLECLTDVIDLALKDERDYPNRSSSGYLALKRLGDRLHHEYESVYGHEESPPALVSKEATGRTLMTPSAGRAAWSGNTVYQFQGDAPRHPAPDLAAHSGQGLHAGQATRTHPDGDGLDELPPAPLPGR
jgi:hypothetical protein